MLFLLCESVNSEWEAGHVWASQGIYEKCKFFSPHSSDFNLTILMFYSRKTYFNLICLGCVWCVCFHVSAEVLFMQCCWSTSWGWIYTCVCVCVCFLPYQIMQWTTRSAFIVLQSKDISCLSKQTTTTHTHTPTLVFHFNSPLSLSSPVSHPCPSPHTPVAPSPPSWWMDCPPPPNCVQDVLFL